MSPFRAFDDPAQVLARTKVVERFLRYVQVDTQSDEEVTDCPTSAGQLELGRRLVEELRMLGLRGVGAPEPSMDDNGYVLAELPGTAPGRVGLCAHLDTAPQFTGAGVRPRMVERYDGGVLEVGHGITLDPEEIPELRDCVGDTLITTDGSTLLGADDKAGIASIMGALEILVSEPDLTRPTVRFCFNPD